VVETLWIGWVDIMSYLGVSIVFVLLKTFFEKEKAKKYFSNITL